MSLRSEVIRVIREYFQNSKKITELPAGSALSGPELFEAVQSGQNVKITATQIATFTGGGGGGGVDHWRGAYDLSVDAYPSSGGSGVAGAIQSGDEWYVSVIGDLDVTGLGVITINTGAIIKALVNTPGTTPENWRVIQ
jgi:hypothetical protein